MSEYEKIKKAVIRSFMWSLSFELSKSVGEDISLPIMQKIAAMHSVASIVKIMLSENRKHQKNMVDDVEEIKMKAWNDLAQKYKDSDVIANIPTMIEALFYNEYEWMKNIKNLERNIDLMARLAIENDVKPKVSRIVTDEYEAILSKRIYEYLKDQK
jgi:hypothetical protein